MTQQLLHKGVIPHKQVPLLQGTLCYCRTPTQKVSRLLPFLHPCHGSRFTPQWAHHPPSGRRCPTCGSSSLSVQEMATTPGRTKVAMLSTWPFTTLSSPHMPRHSQIIFSRPRYSFSSFSMPSRPRSGLRDGCSRHSSVAIRVLRYQHVRPCG